ncbi:hypothetical protein KI387_030856, partial [Taxus chinensis]
GSGRTEVHRTKLGAEKSRKSAKSFVPGSLRDSWDIRDVRDVKSRNGRKSKENHHKFCFRAVLGQSGPKVRGGRESADLSKDSPFPFGDICPRTVQGHDGTK